VFRRCSETLSDAVLPANSLLFLASPGVLELCHDGSGGIQGSPIPYLIRDADGDVADEMLWVDANGRVIKRVAAERPAPPPSVPYAGPSSSSLSSSSASNDAKSRSKRNNTKSSSSSSSESAAYAPFTLPAAAVAPESIAVPSVPLSTVTSSPDVKDSEADFAAFMAATAAALPASAAALASGKSSKKSKKK
jgi:hypothetical protein